MSLSPPVSAGPTGLLEPPLSPGAPVMAREPSRSIEAEMVRMGLMTPDEVAATMREESETGRPFTELAVERGHVSADHMAKIAKPVLPPVHRAPSETQPAAPEQRIPIFADSVLPPRPAATAPVEPLLPPPVVEAPAPPPVLEAAPVLEPELVEPEPVVSEPEPAPVEPEPAPIAVAPEPVVVAPEPIVTAPEPVAVAPEPVVVAPEPIVMAPEPVAVAPDPIVEPKPEPELVVAEAPAPVAEAAPAPPEAAPAPPAPAPTPQPAPMPIAEPQPPVAVEQPVTSPVPTARVTAHVFVRLSNGERIAAGAFDNEHSAEQCAQDLMSAIDTPGSWPRVDGRYVRPDTILSIDLELTGV